MCTVIDIHKIITCKSICPSTSADPNGIFDVKSSDMQSWHVGFSLINLRSLKF